MDAVVECYGGEPTGNASTPEQCTIDTLQEQLALSRSNLNLAREELDNERDSRIQAQEELNNERHNRTQAQEELNNERDARVLSLTKVVNSVNETMSSKLSMLFLLMSRTINHIKSINCMGQ